MVSDKSNIVLIGMAGAGKSSVGRLLARKLGKKFIDTDVLLAQSQDNSLQRLIDTLGPDQFKRIEEEILLKVDVRNHVIATGGSSIYSGLGMAHLKNEGTIVFLKVSVNVLKERVGDTAERGLVKNPWQSFEELYLERLPLYEQGSEVTVECSRLDHEEVCNLIVEELKTKDNR